MSFHCPTIEVGEAAHIASLWWSVMTWSDPGVCMYAFGSTGRVQSEEHRQELLQYIDKDCMPGLLAWDDNDDRNKEESIEELENLREYIVSAPIEPEKAP